MAKDLLMESRLEGTLENEADAGRDDPSDDTAPTTSRMIDRIGIPSRTIESAALFILCCLPSLLVYVFVDPQWQQDGVWMMVADFRSMIPLSEPAYPLLLIGLRKVFGGFSDNTVAAVILVQHVVFSLSLFSFATFFRSLPARVIAVFFVVFPGSTLWIVNGIYKQSLGVSFVLLSVACTLRLAGRENRRPIHWVALFGALYLSVMTRYPTAVVLGLAPLAFLFRFAAMPRREALRPFFQSLALSAGVAASVLGTFALTNIAVGNPPFLSTSGMIVPFKLASFDPSEEELDVLIRSALASAEDPEIKAVIPLLGRIELLDIPSGMVRAVQAVMEKRFHRVINDKEAEDLISRAGAAILQTNAYWRDIWDGRAIGAHLFSDGRISLIVDASISATRTFLADDVRFFKNRIVGPISSLSEESDERNARLLTSWPVSLLQLRWYYGLKESSDETDVIEAPHLDLRIFYYFVFVPILFAVRWPLRSPRYPSGMFAVQLSLALGAFAFVAIMGTIHIFTVQYSITFMVLIRVAIASRAATIDWRAAAGRILTRYEERKAHRVAAAR